MKGQIGHCHLDINICIGTGIGRGVSKNIKINIDIDAHFDTDRHVLPADVETVDTMRYM